MFSSPRTLRRAYRPRWPSALGWISPTALLAHVRLVPPGAASTKMSVEDLTLDCQSDSEDQGVEKKACDLFPAEEADGDGVAGGVRRLGMGGEDDVLYLELFLLFDNLKSFQCIYFNNALIDLEVRTSWGGGSRELPPTSFQGLNEGISWSLNSAKSGMGQ